MIEKIIMATTRPDKLNTILSKNSFNGVIEDFKNGKVTPINLLHDPRYGIIGRVVDVNIEELSDGEFGLMGDVERFDENNNYEYFSDKNAFDFKRKNGITFIFDLRIAPSKKEINFLRQNNIEVSGNLKRSTEHLQIFEVAFNFCIKVVSTINFTNILAGLVVNKILYDPLVTIIKKTINKRKNTVKEFTFLIKYNIFNDNKKVSLSIFFEKLNSKMIDRWFNEDINKIVSLVDLALSDPKIGHVLINYSDRGIGLQQLVRNDAVPITKEYTLILSTIPDIHIDQLKQVTKKTKSIEPAQYLHN
jgi:hypothetical protein